MREALRGQNLDRSAPVFAGGDLGLASFGFGAIDMRDKRVIECVTFRSEPGPTQPRIRALRLWLRARFCDVMTFEDQEGAYTKRLSQKKTNSKSTLARVGEGVGRAWADEIGAETLDITPGQLRAGLALPPNATKQDVRRRVCAILKGVPEGASEHAVDALALAYVGGKIWIHENALRRRRSA